MNQVERGRRLQQLHADDAIFLMPNAWDPGSAVMLASLGFPAIATTSAGVCFSLGHPDQEDGLSRAAMLERVGAVAAAVEVPVSGDLQAGYGADPEEVGQTIASAVARIRGARRAADETGVPFVLTARTDTYLAGTAQPFAEAVARCNAYRDAGADCLFIPGASDAESIAALVREIAGPVTVVMGLSGSTLTVPQLGALGVRRVTIGGSLARAVFGLIRRAATEMAEHGSFSFAEAQIPHCELSGFFAQRRR